MECTLIPEEELLAEVERWEELIEQILVDINDANALADECRDNHDIDGCSRIDGFNTYGCLAGKLGTKAIAYHSCIMAIKRIIREA